MCGARLWKMGVPLKVSKMEDQDLQGQNNIEFNLRYLFELLSDLFKMRWVCQGTPIRLLAPPMSSSTYSRLFHIDEINIFTDHNYLDARFHHEQYLRKLRCFGCFGSATLVPFSTERGLNRGHNFVPILYHFVPLSSNSVPLIPSETFQGWRDGIHL